MNLGASTKISATWIRLLPQLKSLEIEQNNLKALINLSILYSKKSDHINAKSALEQAKAIEPLSLNLNVMASQVFQDIYIDEPEIDEIRRKFAQATRYIQKTLIEVSRGSTSQFRNLLATISRKK